LTFFKVFLNPVRQQIGTNSKENFGHELKRM